MIERQSLLQGRHLSAIHINRPLLEEWALLRGIMYKKTWQSHHGRSSQKLACGVQLLVTMSYTLLLITS